MNNKAGQPQKRMRYSGLSPTWRIALAYAVLSTLWIIFSDRVLAVVVADPAQVTEWQTYKGWFFVAVSTLVLFLLLERFYRRLQATQAALAASELQYRLLVEGAQDYAITMLDSEGRIVSWNHGAEYISGFTGQEVIGQSSAVLFTAEDRAAGLPDKLLEEVRRHGRSEAEGWRSHKNGARYWGNTVVRALTRDDGTVYGFSRISRDLTQRHVAEQRIRNLNRIYSVLSDISQVIVHEREAQTLLAETCRIAVERGGLRMAWIGLIDPATQEVRPVAHAGVVDGYLDHLHIALDDSSAGQGPTARALRSGEPVIVEAIADDPQMAPWRDEALRLGYASSAAFPLIATGQCRGVLNLYAVERGYFDEQEVALLLEMAMDVAFALEVAEHERERIAAEQAQREAEVRLRQAVHAGNVGLWDWDLQTNQVYYSPEWKAQIGYSDDEIGNEFAEWEQRVHPGDLAKTLQTVHAFITNPWPGYEVEFRFRHKDGSYRWILAQASLQSATDGTSARMVGTHIDITAQKKAGEEREELIGQLERRLYELLLLHKVAERLQHLETPQQLATDVIQILEEMLHYEYGAVLLTDETSDSLLPFALSDQKQGRPFVVKDFAYVTSQAPRVGHGITGWVAEHGESVRSDDVRADPRYFAMRDDIRSELCVPLRVGNRVIGVINVETGRSDAYDAADQQLLETVAGQIAVAIHNTRLYQQVQEHSAELEAHVAQRTEELRQAVHRAQTADRLKSTFLATMSHELRTPLNSIIGFTGVLIQELAGPLAQEQKKQLGMVQASARHLLALINDVLDISKIEAGQIEVVREPIAVRDVIDRAVNTVMPLARKKRLALRTTIDPAVDTIVSDRRRVEQILINLLNNAAKFTESGEIEVCCTVEAEYLLVSVRDTGIGIRAEEIELLFQPFQRLEYGLGRRNEGTGLGLSICARLVQILDGEITVTSEWEAGSTFSIRLPLLSKGNTGG